MIFIYKFLVTKYKTQLLVRVNVYMSIMFFIQYTMFVLNLTSVTSPNPYPPGLINYPRNTDHDDLSIRYNIPIFFHFPAFKDL